MNQPENQDIITKTFMILRNKKRKDFEEKEEQYFIKTTLIKFLKKEKLNYTVCQYLSTIL